MDWFTIAAQIVNFLILVALLKRFLYGPIIRAMDKREETIRNRLEKADEKRRQAEETASAYQEKQAELDRKREDIFSEAREQAEQERKDRIHRAREEVDDLSGQWRDAVEREKENFLQDVRQAIGRQAVAIAGKMLADLADVTLEQQAVAAFVRRLEGADDDQRQALTDALRKNTAVRVRTAFEADDDARRRITEAVHQHVSERAEIEFEQDDSLICGVELAVSGSKVAWTLADYLDDTRHKIEQALSQGATHRESEPQREADDQAAGPDKEKPDKEKPDKEKPKEEESEPSADNAGGKEDHAGKSDA